MAHEAFHRLKRTQGGIRKDAVLKLDMSKAYDRVEWCFLRHTLLAFRFHQVWVEKVMLLVNSVSYKYQINGFLG